MAVIAVVVVVVGTTVIVVMGAVSVTVSKVVTVENKIEKVVVGDKVVEGLVVDVEIVTTVTVGNEQKGKKPQNPDKKLALIDLFGKVSIREESNSAIVRMGSIL
jgi:hypothetical protein